MDYLIVGAGASGMAFLDVMFHETDATVAIVDRNDAPGGHWNDAYPFVRLHQSSGFYGVPSRMLGHDRMCADGLNRGLPEMAGKSEILHYYADLMENTYLPSGRVRYFPMSEYLGQGQIRSRVSGAVTDVKIRRKLVDAGFWGDLGRVPATHRRNFDVAPGVGCVAPNDIARHAPDHESFCVLGAGKTAMDTVIWLLGRGIEPARISWVRPNDFWIFQRENVVPHRDFFFPTIRGARAELISLSRAETVAEHCANMEKAGLWHRIDPQVWPDRHHAAVASLAEVAALRQVRDVIRKGRVTGITPERIELEQGTIATGDGRLFIDCTASAGVKLNLAEQPPVFDGDTINVVMIRPFQPLFSAALIAHMEATVDDAEMLRRCTRITNFHDTVAEFLAVQLTGMANQYQWSQVPGIKSWIESCRLNAGTHLLAGIGAEDTEKLALLGEIGPLTAQAAQNLPRILAAG
ncbi:MAG: hypothetical protein NXH82_12665 [Rhodobacteraceae bacterium]|nr:hypothetical protein [Paracoccaceae bacterium]